MEQNTEKFSILNSQFSIPKFFADQLSSLLAAHQHTAKNRSHPEATAYAVSGHTGNE